MDMFRRMFGATGGPAGSSTGPQSTLAAIEKLQESIELLTKKEDLLQKRMAAELEKAKGYMRDKNKRGALQCLKKKKLYQQQADNIQNNILRLEEQKIQLEGMKSTVEMVTALKLGAGAMKQEQKKADLSNVEKTMDEITEQTDKMREIQDLLGQPLADFDDAELDAELEELEAEELDAALLEPGVPTQALPAAPRQLPSVPAAAARAKAPPAKTSEDAELEALQAEMAM